MPLFFFISGYLFNYMPERLKLMNRKWNRLIIPILLYSVFLIPFYILFANKGCIFALNSTIVLQSIIPFNYDIPLWFAPVLFLVILFSNEILRYGKVCKYVLIGALFIIVQLNIMGRIPHIPYVSKTFLASIFFLMGYFAKQYFRQGVQNTTLYHRIISITISIMVLAIMTKSHIDFDMSKFETCENLLVVLLSSASGIVCVMGMSSFFAKSRLLSTCLSFWGRHSFPVFCLHWPIIKVANNIFPPPFWGCIHLDNLPYFIMRWVILLVLMTIFIFVVEKCYRNLFPKYFHANC